MPPFSNSISLLQALSQQDLTSLAGEQTLSSAQAIRENCLVYVGDIADGQLSGSVVADQTYSVNIALEEGSLKYQCTCPKSDAGAICEHSAAVVLEGAPKILNATLGQFDTFTHVRPLQHRLESSTKDELISLILSFVENDGAAYQRIVTLTTLEAAERVQLQEIDDILEELEESLEFYGFLYEDQYECGSEEDEDEDEDEDDDDDYDDEVDHYLDDSNVEEESDSNQAESDSEILSQGQDGLEHPVEDEDEEEKDIEKELARLEERLIETTITSAAGRKSPAVVEALSRHALGQILNILSFSFAEEDSEDEPKKEEFLRNLFRRVQQIHIDTCQELFIGSWNGAIMNPSLLAEVIFNWQKEQDHEILDDVIERYRDVLGLWGVQQYQQFLEQHCRQTMPMSDLMPCDGCGDIHDDSSSFFSKVEAAALITKDFAFLREVNAGSLSSAKDYIRLANMFLRCENFDAAIGWIKRAIERFPGESVQTELRELLFTAHVEAGDFRAAATTLLEQFTLQPSLIDFVELKELCSQTTQLIWSDICDQALTHVRNLVGQFADSGERSRMLEHNSILVELLTSEERFEEAWQAAERGCEDSTLIELAESSCRQCFDKAFPHLIEYATGLIKQRLVEEACSVLRFVKESCPNETALGQFKKAMRDLSTKSSVKEKHLKLFRRRGLW